MDRKTAYLIGGVSVAALAALIGGPSLLDSGWLRWWNWSHRFRLVRNIEYGRYTASNGLARPLLLDVYQPIPHSQHPGSAVIFFHGGGWMAGDKRRAANYLPYLAAAGITAIAPNFRSSLQARFPAQLDDCREALVWVRKLAPYLNIDPHRIGVLGESSGGHMAALLALNPENNLQACSTWSGPSDITIDAEDDWRGFDTRPVRPLLGGWPAEKPELAREASPVHQVHSDAPPFMLVHGVRDSKVPVEQSRRLAAALITKGVSTIHIEVPNGGHGRFWGTQPDHETLLRNTIEFFNDTLIAR